MSVVLTGSGRQSIADRFVMLRRVTASSAYSASLALGGSLRIVRGSWDPSGVTPLALTEPSPLRSKRVIRDPRPRFKQDRHTQSDLIWGHLESQVAGDHLARAVWRIVEGIDVSAIEARYSVLGRHGYPPRRMLALWIYASLVGEHEASKVSARCQTDAAFRWLCGGHMPSPATLKRFRQHNAELFAAGLTHTVKLAHELAMIEVEDLAVDSARLRAHASMKAVRTLKRSTERLKELNAASIDGASDKDRATREEKITKHRDAVMRCETEGRTNFVTTNPLAGLMKFPHGGFEPGHRMTVTAAGAQSRFVLSVLIDSDANDYGKLVESLRAARATMTNAGIPTDKRFIAAADAGYFSREDLLAAASESDWLEVIVAPTNPGGTRHKYFGRDRFTILQNQAPTCPAQRSMVGPYVRPDGDHEWSGVGCGDCSLRDQCTPSGKKRKLLLSPPLENMRRRLENPTTKSRYNRRIATVEPVFAHILDTMAYRRATTRHHGTVRAEILLKLLSHNVARLITTTRLRVVTFFCEWILIDPVGAARRPQPIIFTVARY